MDVGAADGGLADLDEDIVVADFRNRSINHPNAFFGLELGERFHGSPLDREGLAGGNAQKQDKSRVNIAGREPGLGFRISAFPEKTGL
jgi:hypothetical protein